MYVADYVFQNVFKCDVLYITKCHDSHPHDHNQDDVIALFNLMEGSKIKLVEWEEDHVRYSSDSTTGKERDGDD